MLLYTYHPSEPLSKERVEAFSDGVYAIVATLLILDIWLVSIRITLISRQTLSVGTHAHSCSYLISQCRISWRYGPRASGDVYIKHQNK